MSCDVISFLPVLVSISYSSGSESRWIVVETCIPPIGRVLRDIRTLDWYVGSGKLRVFEVDSNQTCRAFKDDMRLFVYNFPSGMLKMRCSELAKERYITRSTTAQTEVSIPVCMMSLDILVTKSSVTAKPVLCRCCMK